MIDIEEFQKIRESSHLIVLDTNILLELYRQPANISIDIIEALKKVAENIYLPRKVYDEYLKNYQSICGSEKKKYQKVSKELSESVRKLHEDIGVKINEYRKHNYTDITKLQSELGEKIDNIQSIIKDFENSHKAEIQLNVDFLQNDKVKEFVDLLVQQEKIGAELPFSELLMILHEGQIRLENLIPPGFMDSGKEGIDKYGDLFVWKSIISIAKEKNANILFICNDVKEDWWEKDKENPIELRQELLKEFKECNPFLDIHFLTLEKFFSYIAEKLEIGKSKSALQLSAINDAKKILDEYEKNIYESVKEYLITINIGEELNEEFLETGDEDIYWNINNVSIEKEQKDIKYYVNLDISVLADLTYQKDGEYSSDAGKVALALIGKIELVLEEYSTNSELKALNIEKNEISHIEPDIWKIISDTNRNDSCRKIIAASHGLEQYKESINQVRDSIKKSYGSFENVDELNRMVAKQTEAVRMATKVVEPIMQMQKTVEPFMQIQNAIEPFMQMQKTVEPFMQIQNAIEPFMQMQRTIEPFMQMQNAIEPIMQMQRTIEPIMQMQKVTQPLKNIVEKQSEED